MKIMSSFIAMLAVLPLFADFDAEYNFYTYNYPTDTFTQLLGINDKGIVAGYHGMNVNKGFIFKPSADKFITENYPHSAQTQVVAINSKGQTAGFYIDTAGLTHGFTEQHGSFKTVDFPNTTFNQLLGRNSRGFSAGYWQDLVTGNDFPYIYDEIKDLFTQIVIPGAVSAQATGINKYNDVSGFYIDAGGVNHGFLLCKDNVTTLDFPGSTFTQALGLNNKGFVVGTYNDATGGTHGFIYKDGFYKSLDDQNGVGTTIINGINDRNEVVGFYVDSLGNTDGCLGKPFKDICQ